MNEQRSWETTTAVLARRAPGLAWLPAFLRQRLTPVALWSAIGILSLGIAYVVNAQRDINRHQEVITELQANRQQDSALLQKIDTQLAVMNSKIGDIATEVDRQREWREHVETEAESRPYPRRHK